MTEKQKPLSRAKERELEYQWLGDRAMIVYNRFRWFVSDDTLRHHRIEISEAVVGQYTEMELARSREMDKVSQM